MAELGIRMDGMRSDSIRGMFGDEEHRRRKLTMTMSVEGWRCWNWKAEMIIVIKRPSCSSAPSVLSYQLISLVFAANLRICPAVPVRYQRRLLR